MQYIEKAIQLKKELDALRPLTQDDEARIMQKFRLDWNYHSNHLEGNSLTYGETKALILFGLTAQGKPLKDHFEITGHDDAVKWISEIVKQERPLSENFIRELHILILKKPYETNVLTPEGIPAKKRVKIGKYKTKPNHVLTKTGEMFWFAKPEETPAMMQNLIEWYREKTKEKDINPILLAVEFHYKFILIHPFDDGNGRTARLLMNFILMQYGYPPVIIKTDDKENYFAALRQADAGILEPFVQYITENLNHSLELIIKGAKGESIEESDDLEKEMILLKQRMKDTLENYEISSKNLPKILSFYDDSFRRIYEKLQERCSHFDRFYAVNYIIITIVNFYQDVKKTSSSVNYANIDNIHEYKRDYVREDTTELLLSYNHGTLCVTGVLYEYDYEDKIKIVFDDTQIILQDEGDKILHTLLYGDKITDNTIKSIIDTVVLRHKNFLEEVIEEFEEDTPK